MSNPRFIADAHPADQPPANLALRCWPLVHAPFTAWPLLLGGAVTATAAGVISGSTWMGGLMGLALAAALWRMWLPVEIEISARGVSHAVLGWRRRIRWREVRELEFHPRGVLLLYDPSFTLLAPLRSLYIATAGRSDVPAIVQYYFARSRQGQAASDASVSHGSSTSSRARDPTH